jgi:hypothetical protein
MTNTPYKVESLKTKPLPLMTKRKKAKEAMLNVKTAIKRVIPKTTAGQRVVAMKVEGLNTKARMTIRKLVIRLPQL